MLECAWMGYIEPSRPAILLGRHELLRGVVQEYTATAPCSHKSLVKLRSNWSQMRVNSHHPLTPSAYLTNLLCHRSSVSQL
jgi:hypothetical protein